MINLEKCEVSFSKRLPSDTIHRVSSFLGFKQVDSHDKYLDLPTLFKRSKKISFSGIKDRVWKKLQGWKEKLLLKAGKEILIKAVAQSIPTYAMSCFKLPSSFCDEVERIIRNFWWGTSNSERGIPWKAWKDLCRPKSEGGLGFRDLKSFNLALLAKQFWRLHLYPNSLLARTLSARYYPKTSIWESKVDFNPSYALRSIWDTRPVINLGVRWRVGDGRSINIWSDAWLGGMGSGKIISPPHFLDREPTVASILDKDQCCCQLDRISEIFLQVDVDRITQVPINSTNSPDERVWAASEDGCFRVRDAYSLALKAQPVASSSHGDDPVWSKLWSLHIQPKAKIFMWRALWNILPHGSNLRRKGIPNVEKCKRCGLEEDNVHVLLLCSWANQVWAHVEGLPNSSQFSSFRDWFGSMCLANHHEILEIVSVCAWQVWCARNELYFENSMLSPTSCFKRASDMLDEYKNANAAARHDTKCRAPSKWCAPEQDSVKLNVDAAVNVPENKIGLGIVARNSVGHVLLAASKTLWPFSSVERAELSAFYWAVDLVKERRWSKVIIEGDAQNVVKALQGTLHRGYHSQVMVDNITHAASLGSHISFSFCFREANSVAHRLARWAIASISSCIW